MEKNIKVSIAIVCFNSSDTIEESIISVINQTYKNIEFIVIDGKSTDGTLDILDKYKSSISVIVSEPDNGIYDAMNKALHIASGEFIMFLGSDDHLMSFNIIEKIVSFMTDSNSIYYGNVFRNSRNDIYKGAFDKFKLSLENICHQSIFYPKAVYKKNFYNTDFKVYADYYYNLTLYPRYSFIYVPLTISYYNCCGFSSAVKDEKFQKIVDSYVKKQFGLVAFLLRKIYNFYKSIR